MKLWDWMTGSRPAPKGAKAESVSKLRARLIGINRETAPFKIRSGEPEGVDLVAEWKIVDAKWYAIFSKAGTKRVFKVLMNFDEDKHVIRAQDQSWEVEWEAGAPNLQLSASAKGKAFKGTSWEKSYEKVWAFREDLSFGEIYEYYFDTSEIKDPLRNAVAAAGWGWKGIAFGKL